MARTQSFNDFLFSALTNPKRFNVGAELVFLLVLTRSDRDLTLLDKAVSASLLFAHVDISGSNSGDTIGAIGVISTRP